MIKVSDYIVARIAELGVRHIFILAGGQSMHLVDSLGSCPDIQHVSALHEQAVAMMTEAYSRTTGNYGVGIVTTGPGGVNAATGVTSAWLDSTPCLFLSGQFRVDCLVGDQNIRQTVLQGTTPVDIMRPITKYAALVDDPKKVRYHLEKAIALSKNGRPGPSWLDIPLDVQAAMVDPAELPGFDDSGLDLPFDANAMENQAAECLRLLTEAKRPVLLAGHGIRIAKGIGEFTALAEKLGIPVLTSINGIDLIHEDHPLFMGRPNYWGQRHANFAIQNADVILSIGAGLHLETTGFNYEAFARAAKLIAVDIDPNELKKKFIKPHLTVHSDAKAFMAAMIRRADKFDNPNMPAWWEICRGWKSRYPVIQPDFFEVTDCVNPFVFIDTLSDEVSAEDVVIPGSAGSHFTTAVQAWKVKKGQRVFSEIGIGAMGHSLPSSIAASVARNGQRTICVTGDGGIQLNMQEMQTVVNYGLPVKMFVMNNGGYMSIRNTQNGYFKGRLVGCEKQSGLGLPDMVRIAEVYGIGTNRIANHGELRGKIREVLDADGPVLCDVNMDPNAVLKPRLTSKLLADGTMTSAPLEDMWPFLDRETFRREMIVPPLEEA